jgi:hypothetical protein
MAGTSPAMTKIDSFSGAEESLYSALRTHILDLNYSRFQSTIAATFNRWVELTAVQPMGWT